MTSNVLSCSKCNIFAGVQYYLKDSKCLSLCSDGTFKGVDANGDTACLDCDSPCSTCAKTSSFCLSCSSNRLIVGQNACGTCPDGQFSDTSSTCALCDVNCKTCSTTADSCTSCGFSPLGYQLFLHTDSICYQSCPSGYYGDTTSKDCKVCDTSCNGCVNSATNCIKCSGSYFRKIGSN